MSDNKKTSCCWVSSFGVLKITSLNNWLSTPKIKQLNCINRLQHPAAQDIVVGWGNKPNTKIAKDFALQHNLNYFRLEDGFICYHGHPSEGHQRLSLIIDEQGIYYDARSPSALERLLNNDKSFSSELVHRSKELISTICRHQLSKYNHHSTTKLPIELQENFRNEFRKKVLLIDQTFGDMSVQYGLSNELTFQKMLQSAIIENPNCAIYIKIHPDVLKGIKQGYLVDLLQDEAAHCVNIIADDCNPLTLLMHFDHVYVVTSQMGFEALLLNKKVTCFGMPFYAGWGLTDDRQSCPRREKRRTREEVFAAAYLLYCRYLDPNTGERCELENILEYLIQTRHSSSSQVDHLYCVDFSMWKQAFVRKFIASRSKQLHFVSKPSKLPIVNSQDAILTWGRKWDKPLNDLSKNVPVWRMEDGFLRSVGLGSDLRRPASLVVDDVGMYYDPNQPSNLETILRETDFIHQDIKRARLLISRLQNNRISKYNVGASKVFNWRKYAGSRKIILVPGQVEDDASILLGTIDVTTNGQLLETVRKDFPDAYIIYKPHPDVTSGNRKGSIPEKTIKSCCDELVTDVDIIDCILEVDQIHTMTSLCGFESLIHNKVVYCYGLPFYAGWGLTNDRHEHIKRMRTLTIEELIAGTLIHYPLYFNWNTMQLTTVEAVIDQLEIEKKASSSLEDKVFNRALGRYFRKIRFLFEALVR